MTPWHCFLDICKRSLPTAPCRPRGAPCGSLTRAPCGRPRSLEDPGDRALRSGGRFRNNWIDFLYINGTMTLASEVGLFPAPLSPYHTPCDMLLRAPIRVFVITERCLLVLAIRFYARSTLNGFRSRPWRVVRAVLYRPRPDRLLESRRLLPLHPGRQQVRLQLHQRLADVHC